MKEFLRKLKLIDNLNSELEIQKNDFVAILKENVDDGSTSFFSDAFDIFTSRKNEYKGEVNFNGFKIKKKRRFLDNNINTATASGTFVQKNNTLIINAEINGFNGMMIPFYIFCVLFYCIFFFIFFATNKIENNFSSLAFTFVIVHAAFMMGIPYFFMRRSTKKLKYELEREFFYLTKEKRSNCKDL